MTRDEIGDMIAALPQGLEPDDLIYRLVNWAVDREREACAKLVEADGLARGEHGYMLTKAATRIRARGDDDIYDVWVEQKPVHASDISQECVDETAKGKHDLWIAAACLKSTVESAIKAGDWKVDGACDPTRDLSYLADCLANPKREWVGLTKDEVDSWELPIVPTVFQFAQFVEAKLKEKNS